MEGGAAAGDTAAAANASPLPDPVAGAGDWRLRYPTENRRKIVHKIFDTLVYVTSSCGTDMDLMSVAEQVEQKAFEAGSCQQDYVHSVSMKLCNLQKTHARMPNLETRSQNFAESVPMEQRGMQAHAAAMVQASGSKSLVVSSSSAVCVTRSSAVHSFVQGTHLTQQNPHFYQQQQHLQPSPSQQQQQQATQIPSSFIHGKPHPSIHRAAAAHHAGASHAQHLHPSLPQQGFHWGELGGHHGKLLAAAQCQPLDGLLPDLLNPRLQQHHHHQPHELLQRNPIGQVQIKQEREAFHPSRPLVFVDQQQQQQQQKLFIQQQKGLEEGSSSTSVDSTSQSASLLDFKEEAYQKIKCLKEKHFVELRRIGQGLRSWIQRQTSNKTQEISNMGKIIYTIDYILKFLQIPKDEIQPNHKEFLSNLEGNINKILRMPMRMKTHPICQQSSDSHSLLHHLPLQTSKLLQQSNHMNLKASMQPGPSSASSCIQLGSAPPAQLDVMPSALRSGVVNLGSLQENSSSSFHAKGTVPSPMLNGAFLPGSGVLQQRHFCLQQQGRQQFIERQYSQWPYLQQLQSSVQASCQAQKMQPVSKLVSSPHESSVSNQTVEGHEFKPRQQLSGLNPGLQQNPLLGQRLNGLLQSSNASSPQTPQNAAIASPSLTRVRTPSLQSPSSALIAPSAPSTPFAPSPVAGEPERQLSGSSSLSNATGHMGNLQKGSGVIQVQPFAACTPGMSTSSVLEEVAEPKENAVTAGKKRPIERLITALKSITPGALTFAVDDIKSLVTEVDCLASSEPGFCDKAAVSDDLAEATECNSNCGDLESSDFQASKRLKRCNSVDAAMAVHEPSNSCVLDASESESTVTSSPRWSRAEVRDSIAREISEINQRLIDTVVCLSSDNKAEEVFVACEGREGTAIRFIFNPVSISRDLFPVSPAVQMPPILSSVLLVPIDYPKRSPVPIDVPSDDRCGIGDLSGEMQSRFRRYLRSSEQPMALGAMAKLWDRCAREVIAEYAELRGGGTFSSRYGAWVSCME